MFKIKSGLNLFFIGKRLYHVTHLQPLYAVGWNQVGSGVARGHKAAAVGFGWDTIIVVLDGVETGGLAVGSQVFESNCGWVVVVWQVSGGGGSGGVVQVSIWS